MNTCSFSPCLGQSEILRVGVIYGLGQSETNTYFISPCLIGYQMGTRVGAQKHTPHIDLTSTLSPLTGRLVGCMQYAPTLPEKDEASSGKCFLSSQTMGDQSVFLFSMSNRLSDRCPGRAQKHTPHIDSLSTPTPFAWRLVGRMQYAPTLSAEKSDLMGWCEIMFGAKGEKSVFHSSMSNRLSDRYPGRGVLHTPLTRLSSTLSPFAGRLVGYMQYAPTLPEKDKVSSGRYYLLSRTMAN